MYINKPQQQNEGQRKVESVNERAMKLNFIQ